jgi:hypothetical protein
VKTQHSFRLGRWTSGYLKKGVHTPMVQGRSTKTISMNKWIRTSRLSRKNSLYPFRQWHRLDTIGAVICFTNLFIYLSDIRCVEEFVTKKLRNLYRKLEEVAPKS